MEVKDLNDTNFKRLKKEIQEDEAKNFLAH